MLETSNWLVVIYSGHQIAEPRDPQYKDALPQEGLAYMVVALFAPPLEAWIRWAAPVLRATASSLPISANRKLGSRAGFYSS